MTAIITGGERGIGRTIATQLKKCGYDIVLNYYQDICDPWDFDIVPVQGDVSKSEDAERIVEKALEAFGRVDVLVNNAGITRDGFIMRMKEDAFDAVIATNLKGTFNMCRAVTKPMLKQKSGHIINISSVVGLMGNSSQSNYAASKAGVIGLTKSLAKELGGKGICVNAVAPGFIQTDMTDKLPPQVVEEMLSRIPLKKLGTASDVGEAVAFLASSHYITGQVIQVDGGMY